MNPSSNGWLIGAVEALFPTCAYHMFGWLTWMSTFRGQAVWYVRWCQESTLVKDRINRRTTTYNIQARKSSWGMFFNITN